MSRIIVKNLPKSITEDKLRQIFGEKGLLTDIQLKYTPEGKFRQFAFIGYHEESEAVEAIKFLNNTCIKTNQITVEPCTILGDVKKPAAWSKHAREKETPKSNDTQRAQKIENKTVDLLDKYKDDPLFEEFMQVHLPNELQLHKENTQIIKEKSNDDSGHETKSDNEENDVKKLADTQISDLEYMKTLMKETKPRQKMEKKVKEKIVLFTIKLRNLPYSCKKKDIKQFFSSNTPYSVRIPRGFKGIAYVGFKTEEQFKKALLKDKSILSGKKVSVIEFDSTNKQISEDDDPKRKKWKHQEESLKNEDSIAESGRIFVRNLAYVTTENDIEEKFSTFGPLSEVSLPIDPFTRKSKGFAIVTFLMPEHAVKAYSELDGSILHGRMLHLLPGLAKDNTNEDEETKNYKQKKAKKQKANAVSSHTWNSLFLGHDAVAEVIADTYGTSKKAVLDPHGDGNAAVRLALGETQIVATTRKFLEQEGVVLDAFNQGTTKRSKTTILVKNLPSSTELKEIRDIFEVHGVIGRIILPPSGITAIVEFVEPSEAKKAFTRLAYSKFKNVPLYLEWAPENALTSKVTQVQDGVNEDKIEISDNVAELDEEEPEPETTIFVKNLNFTTNDDTLRKHFETCGKVNYATVATKKDKNNPGKNLSMGYGFVRFMYKSETDEALKTLQSSSLEGKSLELKRSERTLKNDVKSSRKTSKKTKQTGTKILVRNIPFQANKKEIMDLFRVFGEIKGLRLPKKMTVGSDSHRGFAFVDYFTESDAKKAFEALSQSTHLYGRHLVLEWAASEDGVDQIRKRTADHFRPDEEVHSKKSVFNLDET